MPEHAKLEHRAGSTMDTLMSLFRKDGKLSPPSAPRRGRENPLTFRWPGPLPVRLIRGREPVPALPAVMSAPPWIASGALDQPFDFCGHVRALLEDIVRRSTDFTSIEIGRLLIAVTQARGPQAHGLQARVTPLRFARGRLTRQRRNVVYQVQRYFAGDHEFLYLMTFCLPRFLDQDFDCKLITLFHELYHISPACDGDLRRHDGRYQIHTHSQRDYDKLMAKLAREYLAQKPDPARYEFLRLNFAQLHERHGGVAGIVVPRPKVVPLIQAAKES